MLSESCHCKENWNSLIWTKKKSFFNNIFNTIKMKVTCIEVSFSVYQFFTMSVKCFSLCVETNQLKQIFRNYHLTHWIEQQVSPDTGHRGPSRTTPVQLLMYLHFTLEAKTTAAGETQAWFWVGRGISHTAKADENRSVPSVWWRVPSDTDRLEVSSRLQWDLLLWVSTDRSLATLWIF